MEAQRINNGRMTIGLRPFLKLLDISESVGYPLAAQNGLPVRAIRVGRQYLFPRREVEKVLGLQPGELDQLLDSADQ